MQSDYTKTYGGRKITMDPQRWGGKTVKGAFSPEERYLALDDFYRTYNGGEYYKAFQIEFLDTLTKGLFR